MRWSGYSLEPVQSSAMPSSMAFNRQTDRPMLIELFQPPKKPGVLGGAVMMIADPLLARRRNAAQEEGNL